MKKKPLQKNFRFTPEQQELLERLATFRNETETETVIAGLKALETQTDYIEGLNDLKARLSRIERRIKKDG